MTEKINYKDISMKILERWAGDVGLTGLDINELKRQHSHGAEDMLIQQFFVKIIFNKIAFPEGWEVKEQTSYNKQELNLEELDKGLREFYKCIKEKGYYEQYINQGREKIEQYLSKLKEPELEIVEREIGWINDYIKTNLSEDQD